MDVKVLILIPECLFTYEIADVSGNYMSFHPRKTSLWHNIDLKINRLPHAGDKKRKAISVIQAVCTGKKANLIQCQEIVEVKFKVQRLRSSNVRQQHNPTQIIH